jgi:hypothetical protein
MEARIKLLIVCIAAVCFMTVGLNALAADYDEPQQSTTTSTPPQAVLMHDAAREFMLLGVPPVNPVVISGVPDYMWRHGCGPTAVGNVVGYYDSHGYDDLITGDANTQTNDTNQAMASGGDSGNPNTPGNERHYEDYSRPEDASPILLTDDYITQGRNPHTNDCIGDYQDTSKSTRGNYYGWSWSNDLGPSFTGYVNQQNPTYNPTYTEYRWGNGTLTWAVLTNEINNNRPMVFLVDSGGDGLTDHFVAVVGYDAQTNQYACHDSWAPAGVRWETFQGMAAGQIFGIWGGWSLKLGQPSEVTKWEQLPNMTDYGMDVRCDRRDGTKRVLADDFLCEQTGPITKVRLWGSWKNDANGVIQTIHLSIHSDDPVGIGGTDPTNIYSKPDQLLWSRDFNAPNFSESLFYDLTPDYEWWWQPGTAPIMNGDHRIWLYEIPIDPCVAFIQQGSPSNPIIYWLDAYVVIDVNHSPGGAQFGWKISGETSHRLDDAVWSNNDGNTWMEMKYPPPHPMAGISVDLAFAIIMGQPEPNEPNQPVEPNEPNTPNTKWLQRPDLSSNGIDIRLDDADGVTRHIADDFRCTTKGPITDVHFWGSWKYDLKCPITAILVSFYSDDPCGPGGTEPNNPYSKPNQLLWQRTFEAGEFNETLYYKVPEYEWWWDPFFNDLNPMGDSQVWKYDINIDPVVAFRQEGNSVNPRVYWMELQVWLPYGQSYQFGWKTSKEHWNDDAVWDTGSMPPRTWKELRYPSQHPYSPNSIDMAFAITTGAEPCQPTDPNYKYSQSPDLSENGVDIRMDRRDGVPRMLADDFPCTTKGRITGVKLWGSWLNDIKGNIQKIHLSIHNDIPAWQSPTGYSMPNTVLWQRDFNSTDFNEVLQTNLSPFFESWWDPYTYFYQPLGDQIVWRYDIRIPWDYAFGQQGDINNPKVYWLDAYVVLGPNIPSSQFGWKTSCNHWNDDAVRDSNGWLELRYPEGHPYSPNSIDLAFEITTMQECFRSDVNVSQYNAWVAWGKPACWCYRRQCRGDINGLKQGIYWVSAQDLAIFKLAFNKNDSSLTLVPNGICADNNRSKQGIYRVSAQDLVQFKLYLNKSEASVPICDANYVRFWTN